MVILFFLNLVIFQFKSVYREYNQSVEPYNFLAVNVLSKLERLGKSVLSEPSISFNDVRIYVPEQKLALLADDLPYSRKNWVDGYVVDQTDLERVKIRIRGDNPNNWLHDKKSWRLKRPKGSLKDKIRTFNYVLPKDPSLLNTYIGYFIAHRMGLIAPKVRFVDVFVNDKIQGLYLEIPAIDENFVRNQGIMPVNLYKGSPSRTDKPLYVDTDLFNNPSLWELRAEFNGFADQDKPDLIRLLKAVRAAQANGSSLSELKKLAPVRQWAAFSAYETIMQTWHNYEKNNLYLLSDPWVGSLFPVAYDSVFNDTKSAVDVREKVLVHNAAHALTEVFSNDAEFLAVKHKVVRDFIKSGGFADVKSEIARILPALKGSWRADPSHVQHALVHGFGWRSVLPGAFANEVSVLIDRLTFIEEVLNQTYETGRNVLWAPSQFGLTIELNSVLPVTQVKVCAQDNATSRQDTNRSEGDRVSSLGKGSDDNCITRNHFLASSMVRAVSEPSRATTFKASDGFDAYPTIFRMNIPVSEENEVYVKFAGDDKFTRVVRGDVGGRAPNFPSLSINADSTEAPVVLKGTMIFEGLNKFTSEVLIEPGTVLLMKEGASLLFERKVIAAGVKGRPILVQPVTEGVIWDVFGIVGEKTEGSHLKHINISGGSGGFVGGKYFTGMVSIRSTSNIVVEHADLFDNKKFDDLVHVLYSSDVAFSKIRITNARADGMDVDISKRVSVVDSTFERIGNDAIDSMTSVLSIRNSRLSWCGDKGVSVGENSDVTVHNVTLSNALIGIQSKDGSVVRVRNSRFNNNQTQLDAYMKNWRYNDGGQIVVTGSSFVGDENIINAAKRSSVTVNDSVFPSPSSVTVGKRVKLNNTSYDGS